jgi:hypothetical protein
MKTSRKLWWFALMMYGPYCGQMHVASALDPREQSDDSDQCVQKGKQNRREHRLGTQNVRPCGLTIRRITQDFGPGVCSWLSAW